MKSVDLTNKRFGRLTVIAFDSYVPCKRRGRYKKWKCKCDCGNEIIAYQNSLVDGSTKSCGCYQREKIAMIGKMRRGDLTGKRFGKLVVVKEVEEHGYIRYWECQCDCGNTTVVAQCHLKNGHTKSCGCYQKEQIAALEGNGTHYGSYTRLYRIWHGMKQRCYNPKARFYNRYGGRGIIICQEWIDGFENFRDWSLEHGYADDLSIDRIDNDGIYAPSNCRWATGEIQNHNKSTTLKFNYDGETRTLKELSEISGLAESLIYKRISSKGWSVEKAVLTPKKNNDRHKLMELNGVVKTLDEWSKEYNIPYKNLRERVCRHGWNLEKALKIPIKKITDGNENG